MRALIVLITLAGIASPDELRIRVVDERGQPVWARLEVHGAGGRMLQPAQGAILSAKPSPTYRSPYLGSFVVQGECLLDAAPGQYRVVAEHGAEYERAERTVDVPAAGAVEIRLAPWIRMRERGWWSGDMHVHRPVEDSRALIQAEDLNVGVVFTMWNRQNLWEGKSLPQDPVIRVTPDHLLTVMNAEDERGGGAWMLHHLREPLGIEKVLTQGQRATESWFPAGIDFVRRARSWRKAPRLFPWFDSEKPIWWEVPVMMAIEPPDSLGLLHNHFDQYGMYENEAWGRPRDTQRYPGLTGFADYSLGLGYRYLNLGLRVPPSAGSASGVLPNPVGYNRMYVKLDGPLTIEKWYQGVRAGRVMVTNGPMLFWKTKQTGMKLGGEIEVLSREPLDRVEVVANGEVVWRRDVADGSTKYKERFEIEVSKHSWAAARCFVKNPLTVRMAHTAPVALPGRFSTRADAAYFAAWIDELMAKPAVRERPELLDLYKRARAFYTAR